jgi:Fe-S-cluster containining protein
MGESPDLAVSVCTLRLRLGGEVVEAEARIPAGLIRLVDLLPALQKLTDAVVDAAARQAERDGKAISCRKGCGACCRQPVPIAEAEAAHLAELIAAMPTDRQASFRRRFRRGIRQLRRAGLLDAVRRLGEMPEDEERQRLGVAYFQQHIPCPFLEDESCSIHPRRPLSCREYLVTSPAAHCSEPAPGRVERVPVPARPSVALYRLGEGAGGPRPRWLPMILALEWAARQRRAPAERFPGARLLEAFLRHLSGGERPKPARGQEG